MTEDYETMRGSSLKAITTYRYFARRGYDHYARSIKVLQRMMLYWRNTLRDGS